MKNSVELAQNPRWKIAQDWEYEEWLVPGTIKAELKEGVDKYGKTITLLKKKYQITSKLRLIDIGCGPTFLGRLFKTRKPVGIDPLAHRLNYERSSSTGSITTGLAEALPFPEGSFDVVFSRNALDHAVSPNACAREVRRVVTTDGLVIISLYVYAPLIAVVKRVLDYIPVINRTDMFKNIGHPHVFTENSFSHLFTRVGLTELESIDIHVGRTPYDYGKMLMLGESKLKMSLITLLITLNRICGAHYFHKEVTKVFRPTTHSGQEVT